MFFKSFGRYIEISRIRAGDSFSGILFPLSFLIIQIFFVQIIYVKIFIIQIFFVKIFSIRIFFQTYCTACAEAARTESGSGCAAWLRAALMASRKPERLRPPPRKN